MRNFIADVWNAADFLKSYWAKWSRKQVAPLKGQIQNLYVQTTWQLF